MIAGDERDDGQATSRVNTPADSPGVPPTAHPAIRCVVLGAAQPIVSHDPHALAASLAVSGVLLASPSRPARLWLAEACVLIPPAAPKRSATPSLDERQAAVDNTVIIASSSQPDASSSQMPVSRPSPAKARRRQQREAESHLARVLLCELAAAQGIQLPLEDWSPRGQAPRHPALPKGFYVSIAHRHGHVLVGLATVPLGLDLEYRNPRHAHDLDARIAMLPLDARERLAEASHLSETERLDGFYQEWVRYEALVKYVKHY